MVRTLARTATILVLAAAVAAGLYLVVPSPDAPLSDEGLGQGNFASFDDDLGDGGWDRPSPHRGERRLREEGSLGRGIAGTAGTALQIAVVGSVVAALQKRSRRRHWRRGEFKPCL